LESKRFSFPDRFLNSAHGQEIFCTGHDCAKNTTKVSSSFDYSSDALHECESFFKRSGKVIVPLTVREILDEEIARKLA
jgi:hypothetical protein